ncbi:polyphosphate kinase 1 [candidate division WOR-3 bacterium]|nr:polyphosphate kinase 1 [candidate division WOR-3 bacterium]
MTDPAIETNEEHRRLFIHREMSWLAFNERVLEEALDRSNPLLERAKFVAIFVNNLDEFYMVRVAGVKRLIDAGYNKADGYGWYPGELNDAIDKKVRLLMKRLYEVHKELVHEELRKEGIFIHRYDELEERDRKAVNAYFDSTLNPLMTPMAVDQGRPFPVLPSKTISFSVQVKRGKRQNFAILPLPTVVPRLFQLRSTKNQYRFILIDEIIRNNIHIFFRGYEVVEAVPFRVLRDSELDLEEDYADDLLVAIEQEVKKRPKAKAVYVGVEREMSSSLLTRLSKELEINKTEVRQVADHLDLAYLFDLYTRVDRPELKYKGYVPMSSISGNVFENMRKGDSLIHLPYQSFDPVARLIESAATDHNVLAIKMTLYRTNRDSCVIKSLKKAAARGAQVSILVEIRARFDEERNILWVRELERAGCHVMYAIPDIKIHSKICLIIRRERDGIHRYVHLSTGNYNEMTACVYTDLGLFTASEDYGRDVSDVFNVISGYSQALHWSKVVSSPEDLRQYFFQLIDQEINNQKKHENGFIFVKMNSLQDRKMIYKLYEASQAGVRINLLVRGICCLIPGLPNTSETIEVRSIVGRFLEHSRIFLFNNNGNYRVFMSSADWMRRNFDRRIELLFPIEAESSKAHLKWLLEMYWKDTLKTRLLNADGFYKRIASDKEPFNIQEYLISYYSGNESG